MASAKWKEKQDGVQIQQKKIWHLDLIISFEKYSKVKA